jgi:hypothetical protein
MAERHTILWPKEKDKQWSTKHCTENEISSNTNPTKKPDVNWGAPEGLAVPDPIVTRYTFIYSNKYPDASNINEASQYYNLPK